MQRIWRSVAPASPGGVAEQVIPNQTNAVRLPPRILLRFLPRYVGPRDPPNAADCGRARRPCQVANGAGFQAFQKPAK